MLDYFGVSIIHKAQTWTTGSLTCFCDLSAGVYKQGPHFIVLSKRLLFYSASLHRAGLQKIYWKLQKVKVFSIAMESSGVPWMV